MSEEKKPAELTPKQTAAGCGCMIVVIVGIALLAATCSGDPPSGERTLAASDVAAAWTKVSDGARSCDVQSSLVAVAGDRAAKGRGDMVTLFDLVKSAQRSCLAAFSALSDIKPASDLRPEEQKKLQGVLDACVSSYSFKVDGLGKMATVLDEGEKLSTISAMRSALSDANVLQVRCVAGFGILAQTTKADIPDLRGFNSPK